MTRHVIAVCVAALLIAAGYGLRACTAPAPPPGLRTDTVYVDRQILRRDTVTVDRPVVRRIFERTADTVRVEVPLPAGTPVAGVITPTPIRLRPGRVTLTYWQPDSLRWQQDVYRVPRAVWGFGVSTGATALPGGAMIDARAEVRYRRLTAWAGYGAGAHGADRVAGPVFGVRLRWGVD